MFFAKSFVALVVAGLVAAQDYTIRSPVSLHDQHEA